MRLVHKILPILIFGLILIGLNSPIKAETNPFANLKFPEVNPPAWATGQSATYKVGVTGIPDVESVGMTLRISIVGQETIESQKYYWTELGIKDLTGLPPEASSVVKTLKIKFLTKFISNTMYQDDPKKLLNDIAAGNVIRKIVFQLNQDDPQVIDFMTIQGMVQGMTGQDLKTLIDEMPMDKATPEGVAEKVKVDCGQESVKIANKVFNNAQWCTFTGGDETGTANGKIYAHETVPVTALLKFMMNFTEAKEKTTMTFNMDLLSYETTGAKSEIIGTPKPFDFSSLMGPMTGMEKEK
jgi:hypothetical protein